ncbi:DUF4376 domain-containing protein [Psychrobacter celer]|uniref:DUF4376 domain-containing protein n=1 Tax=Psychrobacter celer TaxID=306572 RepID=UPI003FD3F5F5
MINVYVYSMSTKRFEYKDMGLPHDIFRDLSSDHDFTLTPPPDYEHVWRWVDTEWVADEPEPPNIPELQAQVWEGIKAKRLDKVTSGVYIPSIDKRVHTDADTSAMYAQIGSSILLGTFEEMNWKAMDNTFFNMTESVFKEIQTEMMRQTQRYHAKAEYHKVMLLAANDPLEYNYHDDW